MSWAWRKLDAETSHSDLVRYLNKRLLELTHIVKRITIGALGQLVLAPGTANHPAPAGIQVSYDASGDEFGDTHSAAVLEIQQDTATARSMIGVVGVATMAHGSGTQSQSVMGVEGFGYHTGAGTSSDVRGVTGTVLNDGAGTVTAASALRAGSISNTGGGAITTAYGLYVVAVTAGGTNYAIYTNGGAVRFGGRTIYPYQAFSANDATPSVAGGRNFQTANTGSTTITGFDDGVDGQEIHVLIQDGNTTVDFTGTTLKGNAGVDWSPANGDAMRCVFDGANWTCQVIDATA